MLVNRRHHPEDFSLMDKWLKKKLAGSTILLVLFIFLLSSQSAWSAKDEAEILIFSLSPAKVKEQQGVLKIQISTFSPIQQVTVKGKPVIFLKEQAWYG